MLAHTYSESDNSHHIQPYYITNGKTLECFVIQPLECRLMLVCTCEKSIFKYHSCWSTKKAMDQIQIGHPATKAPRYSKSFGAGLGQEVIFANPSSPVPPLVMLWKTLQCFETKFSEGQGAAGGIGKDCTPASCLHCEWNTSLNTTVDPAHNHLTVTWGN